MERMDDLREEDIRICRNNRCSRFKMLIATTNQRCAMCNSRLRKPKDEELMDDDAPVMIEGSSSSSAASPVHMPPPDRLLPAAYTSSSKDDEPGVFSATTNGEHCDLTEKCPVMVAPELRIPFALYQNGTFLAHKFDVEWIAYMKGVMEGNNYALEEELIFPLQRARQAHVQAESKTELEGVIAAIHSHVQMNAYFSGEDKKHWNMPVEMVINSRGEVAANVRIKLDCGRWARVKPRILLVYSTAQQNLEAQLKEKLIIEQETVKEKSAVVVTSGRAGDKIALAKNDAKKGDPISRLTSEKGWHVTQGGLVVLDGRGWKDPEAAAQAFKHLMDHQPN